MTQSSLSKRILDLEAEIGEPLFDRSGPRARITDLGERIFAQAQEMLTLRDSILTTAHGSYELRGTCRFGVSELVALTWLPEVVSRVRAAYPRVTLAPRVALAQELIDDVLRANTDFALGPGSSPDTMLQSHHLTDVEMAWVCAPGFLASDAVLTTALLGQHPVISMSAQSSATAALDAWAVRKGVTLRRMIASNSMGAVAALAAAGLGLSLMPWPYARELVRQGRLCRPALAPGLETPDLPYYIHWRRDNAEALTQAVRDVALSVGSSQMALS